MYTRTYHTHLKGPCLGEGVGDHGTLPHPAQKVCPCTTDVSWSTLPIPLNSISLESSILSKRGLGDSKVRPCGLGHGDSIFWCYPFSLAFSASFCSQSPAAEKAVKPPLSEVFEPLLAPSEDSAGCFKEDKRGWCVLVRQGRFPGIDWVSGVHKCVMGAGLCEGSWGCSQILKDV